MIREEMLINIWAVIESVAHKSWICKACLPNKNNFLFEKIVCIYII